MNDRGLMAPRKPRRRRLSPLIGWIVLIAILVTVWLVGAWYFGLRGLDWAVRHGVALQAQAKTPAELAAALSRWERETQPYWRDRPVHFVERIFEEHSLTDAHVRRLLAFVTGADYGDRIDDWRRWLADQQRLRAGEQPEIAKRDRVTLEPVWSAAVGLTYSFSSILPIDGDIFIASCGRSFDDATDDADGIIRVRARSGHSDYLFEPPDRGPRDVLGLAATDRLLIAACRNGYLYGVTFDGRLEWKATTATKLASIPLIFENESSTPLVAVVTETAKVVAFSVATGKTIWVSDAPSAGVNSLSKAAQQVAPQPRLSASLALGDVLGDARPELILASANGDVRILASSDGKVLLKRAAHAGGLAGVVVAGARDAQPLAYSGDLEGGVWAVYRSADASPDAASPAASDTRSPAGRATRSGPQRRRSGTGGAGAPQIAPLVQLTSRGPSGIVAPVRLVSTREQPQRALAALSGFPGRLPGALALADTTGLAWRYPLPGCVWSGPAVADLNANGEVEIIAVSFGSDVRGQPTGWLDVVSKTGQCLRRARLPAPAEAAPVVADVDGDGRVDVLVADRSGMLHCFRSGPVGPIEWGLPAGDPRNTRNGANAYSYSQTPFGRQARWQPQ